MTKPPANNYIFIHYSYGSEHQPQLSLLEIDTDKFVHLEPSNQLLTLAFDMSQRYCNGWHDLATAESHPCPDVAILPDQYDQCRHCQVKTGFNPAFYNASSVSPQQQTRNAQPHILYLAHFAPGVVKVGISWADRGIRRLLDQGARSALILKSYPNADIARQYEARAARLDGIAETLQTRQKLQYLKQPYDAAIGTNELVAARERLAQEAGVKPDDNQPLHLDRYYLGANQLQPNNLIDVTKHQTISGMCIGMVGSSLVTEQAGLQFVLPLSKLIGYRVKVSYDEIKNQNEPHQVSLF